MFEFQPDTRRGTTHTVSQRQLEKDYSAQGGMCLVFSKFKTRAALRMFEQYQSRSLTVWIASALLHCHKSTQFDRAVATPEH